MVGSASASCHWAIGNWLVKIVARRPVLSSTISKTSAAWSQVRGLEEKVIDHEHLYAGPGGHESCEAAIDASDRELFEHARATQVQRGVSLANRRIRERTSQERLSGAGWAENRDAVMVRDPVALGKSADDGALESASGAEVDVFDESGDAQPRCFQVSCKASVLPFGQLPVDEQP